MTDIIIRLYEQYYYDWEWDLADYVLVSEELLEFLGDFDKDFVQEVILEYRGY